MILRMGIVFGWVYAAEVTKWEWRTCFWACVAMLLLSITINPREVSRERDE